MTLLFFALALTLTPTYFSYLLRLLWVDRLDYRWAGVRSLLLEALLRRLRGGHAERHAVVQLVARVVAMTSRRVVCVVVVTSVLSLVAVAVVLAAWAALV